MRSKLEFQHHRDRMDRIPRAPLRAPVGSIDVPRATFRALAGSIEVPWGTFRALAGSIDVPRATFRALGGSINAPCATFRTLLDSMEVSGAIFGNLTGSVDALEQLSTRFAGRASFDFIWLIYLIVAVHARSANESPIETMSKTNNLSTRRASCDLVRSVSIVSSCIVTSLNET